MKRPRILVCNDDGIFSKGIRTLADSLSELGDVTVVAPSAQQSAVGHALTVAVPLRAERYEENSQFFGWAVNGTPADCVKLAVQTLLPERPDLLVSGINFGKNTAISLVYSGTVSGATEGTMLGVPSIAISLDDMAENANFLPASKVARRLAEFVLDAPLPAGVLLNVNVPKLPFDEIKGVKVVPQGESFWDDKYDERIDPMGRTYFWLHGDYQLVGANSDDHALREGFVSVTPVHYRLTDDDALSKLKESNLGSILKRD